MLTYEGVKSYSKRYAANDDGSLMTSNDAGVELDRRVKQHMADHPGLSYRESLELLLNTDDGQALLRSYSTRPPGDEDDGVDPAEFAHSRALKIMQADRALSYAEAVERVFQSNPALRDAYANYSTSYGGS